MGLYLYRLPAPAYVTHVGRLSGLPEQPNQVVKLLITHSTEARPPRFVFVPYSDLEELHKQGLSTDD